MRVPSRDTTMARNVNKHRGWRSCLAVDGKGECPRMHATVLSSDGRSCERRWMKAIYSVFTLYPGRFWLPDCDRVPARHPGTDDRPEPDHRRESVLAEPDGHQVSTFHAPWGHATIIRGVPVRSLSNIRKMKTNGKRRRRVGTRDARHEQFRSVRQKPICMNNLRNYSHSCPQS